MYEVAERFYMALILEDNEFIEHAEHESNTNAAEALKAVLADILESPEHLWFTTHKVCRWQVLTGAAVLKGLKKSVGGSDETLKELRVFRTSPT